MICLALVCSTKAFGSFFPKSSPISFNLWSILNCKKKCTNFDQPLLYMNLEISLDDAISNHGKLGQLNDSLALLIFLSDWFSLPVQVTIFVWFQFSYLVLLSPAYTSGVTSQVKNFTQNKFCQAINAEWRVSKPEYEQLLLLKNF